MAKKITYLLGAGASANTIPVVAQFHQRMQEISQFLKACLPSMPDIMKKPFNIDTKYVKTLKTIIEDFDWLVDQAGDYFTIDTLAKKYYLSEENENLIKLKKVLVTYFTLEQFILIDSRPTNNYTFYKNSIDKRYDSFIASVAQKNTEITTFAPIEDDRTKIKLNKDLKILSWNYDIQLERSLQRFLHKKIHFLQSEFQIFPNKRSLNETSNILMKRDRFAMIKLNGNAIWDEFANQPTLNNVPTIFDSYTTLKDNKPQLEFYLDKYQFAFFNPITQQSNEPVEYFNFAWENDINFSSKFAGHSINLEAAELIATETEILVVIGYSFPIFNREIDNNLFKKMEKLEKVYIQDREPERIKSTMQNAFEVLQRKKIVNSFGNEVTSTSLIPNELRQVDKISFQLESNTSQFIIPYELTNSD
jgi:hypothetical protein